MSYLHTFSVGPQTWEVQAKTRTNPLPALIGPIEASVRVFTSRYDIYIEQFALAEGKVLNSMARLYENEPIFHILPAPIRNDAPAYIQLLPASAGPNKSGAFKINRFEFYNHQKLFSSPEQFILVFLHEMMHSHLVMHPRQYRQELLTDIEAEFYRDVRHCLETGFIGTQRNDGRYLDDDWLDEVICEATACRLIYEHQEELGVTNSYLDALMEVLELGHLVK